MMALEDALHLSLEARPESIGRARAAVGELAAELGMEEPALGDLKTIVSEACTNVVADAYGESDGTFEIEAFPEGGPPAVIVRDFGQGMRARIEPNPSSLGLGLGLISTLSSHFDISGGSGGGTEVLMRLPPTSSSA